MKMWILTQFHYKSGAKMTLFQDEARIKLLRGMKAENPAFYAAYAAKKVRPLQNELNDLRYEYGRKKKEGATQEELDKITSRANAIKKEIEIYA